jgi:hypothetical protein
MSAIEALFLGLGGVGFGLTLLWLTHRDVNRRLGEQERENHTD